MPPLTPAAVEAVHNPPPPPPPPPPEPLEPTLELDSAKPFIDPAPVNAAAAAQDSVARQMAEMMAGGIMTSDVEADPLESDAVPAPIVPPAPVPPVSTSTITLQAHPPALDAVALRSLLKPMENGTVTLPDGSMRVAITIPEEMVLVLKEWAEGAGEDFVSYVQRQAEIGLNAIVLGTAAG